MTTIAFSPSPTATPPFSTSVLLDGAPYTLKTFWNIFRGDWYYSLTDQSGNVIITAPLIASPDNAPIYLAPGIFTSSTIYFLDSSQSFVTDP